MNHLGQRLSALIDGELDCAEIDRALGHLARCSWCQDEAAALRALKRRMSALGDTAAGAGVTGLAGLTGRLMSLTSVPSAGMWSLSANAGTDGADESQGGGRTAGRASWYFLSASVAVFLAGVGTAAFIAGGDPQAQTPAPAVTPSVDVLILQRDDLSGVTYGSQGLVPSRAARASHAARVGEQNRVHSLP